MFMGLCIYYSEEQFFFISYSCMGMQLTCLLSEVGLNIQEAHAFSTTDGYSLDVFVVDGWPNQVPIVTDVQ